MLMSVLQRQVSLAEADPAAVTEDTGFDEFTMLCAGSVDGSAARECNESSSQQWPAVIKALQWSFGPGMIPVQD
jgi:hypothetical protein